MNNETIKILLVDDDKDDKVLFEDILTEIPETSYHLEWTNNFSDAKKALSVNNFDICMVDYHLGKYTGVDLIKYANKKQIEKPFVLLTGQNSKESDFEANDAGAFDYILKSNINSESLERTIRYAISRNILIKRAKGNEIKYKALFQNSKDGIVLTNKNFDVIESNPAFSNFLGIDKISNEQSNLKDFIENQEIMREVKKELNSQNYSEDKEIAFIGSNGEEKYGLIFFNKYTQTDGEVIFQCILRDITKRKKAEKELIHLQRIEAASDTAQALAHEVRNPLMSINLAIEFLRESYKEDTAEKYFEIIDRSSKRINGLITDLLNSSKDSGFEFEKTNLSLLLKNAISLVQDRAELKNIEIVQSIQDFNIMAYISILNFEMAITNILVNAIEALESKHDGLIKVELYKFGEEAIIKISDNGKGISQEKIEKIFTPFYSEKKTGVGLGLTATQNIIVRHKGRIEVESKPNLGTSFYIYINCI